MIDIATLWDNPPAVFRGAPFWSWNSKLVRERLCSEIESMHRAGLGGFFMHSRYGLKTPYLSDEWFECIFACVEKARELDMKAYLYDEDRWPSGAAGGIVTRAHKEFRLHYLVVSEPQYMDEKAERIGTFSVELDGKGRLKSYRPVTEAEVGDSAATYLVFGVGTDEPTGWTNDGGYLDTMNADAVAEYVRVTHAAYAERHGADFGSVVPAIFTDEPHYGYWGAGRAERTHRAPWTRNMLTGFRNRRGYDLRDHLPELVLHSSDGAFSKVRHDYYRTLTELFVENFGRQIGQWCGRHSIALTGHVLMEGALDTQVRAVGATMPFYEHMQWPGIDILCDQADELLTAKQCSSVADQLGRERVLSELYGCTGWDWPLEGHKFIGDWQYAVGVNFRCPHLTHYSLAGGAKRDYPASIIDHSPWWKYYRVVEDYFARLSLMLTQGVPIRDVLVIHPVESAWGLFCHAAHEQPGMLSAMEESLRTLIYTLTGEHLDWDFADESLLAKHGEVKDGALVIGRMSYRLIIVPPSVTLRGTTVELLRKMISLGGKVLFIGERPTRMDGEPSDFVRSLADQADTCSDRPEEFVLKIEALVSRRLSITENGAEQHYVWAMLRAIDGWQLLFVQSHDRKKGHCVHVCVPGEAPALLWDAVSGKKTLINARIASGRIEFDLELGPSGSALVSLGLSSSDVEVPSPPAKVVEIQTISGPFEIWLTEPNTLPLDYCSFRVGEEPFSEIVPTLRADQLIRARYGLGTRLGGEHQPWYLYAMGAIDTKPRDHCQIRWTFHVTDKPNACKLALENPEDYEITVNGKVVDDVAGYFVDEDIETIDITKLVQEGENEVLLSFNYRPDMEIEDLYLVGEFGVGRRDENIPRQPGNVTLIAPIKQLRMGSWVGQGLDFYGAAVCYRLSVDRPSDSRRVRISLPEICCTAAAIHVGGQTFVLPWAPFVADITDAMADGQNDVVIEVIGGRKNILGPLHTPWERGTGPHSFSPDHGAWTLKYQLTDHGLMGPLVVETAVKSKTA